MSIGAVPIAKINLTEREVLCVHHLRFSICEFCVRLPAVRVSATDRFVRKLEDLLREQKRHRRNPKAALASYCGKESASWVSNLLAKRSTDPRINLDDLWNIAGFFRVSVNELLGAPRTNELSGDEHRLFAAFRVLPSTYQDHFLALMESAALGVQIRKQNVQPRLGTTVESGHDVAPPGSAEADLHALRSYLTRIVVDLGAASAGEIPDSAVLRTGEKKSKGR